MAALTCVNALYNGTRYNLMNTGFLGSPAPSNGYDAVLGALAPHSAPREGSLGGTDPSVHNRVKQTFINPVASYPFIARRWKAGWEQSFHPGDLMFIFTGQDCVQTKRHSTLANLPVLNHIMRDKSMKQFHKKHEWTFIGVMRNSSTASNMKAHKQSGRHGGNAAPAERIINIDVRGATRMFNYWTNAAAGQHLRLAWVDMEVDTGNMPDVMKRPPNAKNDSERRSVWQLLPYDKDMPPHLEDNLNVWHNDQIVKSKHYLSPICAGWVFQTIGNGEISSNKLAIRKATQLGENRFCLPIVHVFLNV